MYCRSKDAPSGSPTGNMISQTKRVRWIYFIITCVWKASVFAGNEKAFFVCPSVQVFWLVRKHSHNGHPSSCPIWLHRGTNSLLAVHPHVCGADLSLASIAIAFREDPKDLHATDHIFDHEPLTRELAIIRFLRLYQRVQFIAHHNDLWFISQQSQEIESEFADI